jgi:hypothetical protein
VYENEKVEVNAILDAFADGLLNGRMRAVCAPLAGRARAMQGCGDPEREGVDAKLLLSVRRRSDLRIEQVGRDFAVVSMPDYRPTPAGSRQISQPGLGSLDLVKENGRWMITDIKYPGP